MWESVSWRAKTQIIKQILFIISMLMHSYNGKDVSGCAILAHIITLFKDCKQCGVSSAQTESLLYKVTEALDSFSLLLPVKVQ